MSLSVAEIEELRKTRDETSDAVNAASKAHLAAEEDREERLQDYFEACKAYEVATDDALAEAKKGGDA